MLPRIYQKRYRTGFCVGILLFAAALRLAAAPSLTEKLWQTLRRFAGSEGLFRFVMLSQSGMSVESGSISATVEAPARDTAQETRPAPMETETPTDTQPQETEQVQISLPEFTQQEAQAIAIRGNCTYTVDKAALLTAPLCWRTPSQGPQVLIIHTHTSEAYTPSEGYEYTASGNYRTQQADRSVVAVGDALAECLEENGISVLHDTQLHDYPSYNDSYASSKTAIEEYLNQYPSIVMVVDVHRDAAENADGTQVRQTAQIGGQTCAALMLVVGTDEGGLYHPYWQENLSCALKLQALLNREYPGLCRDLSLRAERFNQHETPASLLVEVGSTGNTLPEALTAAQYLGDTLAELLLANME